MLGAHDVQPPGSSPHRDSAELWQHFRCPRWGLRPGQGKWGCYQAFNSPSVPLEYKPVRHVGHKNCLQSVLSFDSNIWFMDVILLCCPRIIYRCLGISHSRPQHSCVVRTTLDVGSWLTARRGSARQLCQGRPYMPTQPLQWGRVPFPLAWGAGWCDWALEPVSEGHRVESLQTSHEVGSGKQ